MSEGLQLGRQKADQDLRGLFRRGCAELKISGVSRGRVSHQWGYPVYILYRFVHHGLATSHLSFVAGVVASPCAGN